MDGSYFELVKLGDFILSKTVVRVIYWKFRTAEFLCECSGDLNMEHLNNKLLLVHYSNVGFSDARETWGVSESGARHFSDRPWYWASE